MHQNCFCMHACRILDTRPLLQEELMKQSREVEEEAKKYEKAPNFARCMQDVMELCQE